MNITKINKLLKALSSDERKQFAKNLKKDVATYYLFKYLNTKSDKDIGNKDKMVSAVIKTDRKYPKKALDNTAFELYKLLKEWLITKELEADELTRNKLLANAFKRYNLTDAYFETLGKREELIETKIHPNMWCHLDGLRLAHERYFYSANDFRSDTAAADFTKIVHHLKEFHALAQSIYRAEQVMRNFKYNEQKTWYKHHEIDVNDTENPLAQLYILISKLLENPDNQVYKNVFLPLLEKNIDELPPKNRSSLLTLQINYAGMQVQKGNTGFFREYYEAYRVALDGRYFEFEGPLNTDHFMNAVTAAAALEEFEWGRKFIDTASDRLLNEEVENIQRLAKALFCLYEKETEKCWASLKKVSFDSLEYRTRLRCLRAQCGYELVLADKWEENNKNEDNEKPERLFSDELDAYRQFMQRERANMPPFTYDANVNLINLLMKVYDKPRDSQEIFEKALGDIEKPLIATTWLKKLLKK